MHLITSEFHLERARMIFLRAAALFLREAGCGYELCCHPCIHSTEANIQRHVAMTDTGFPIHIRLEEQQRAVYNQHTDEVVRMWT